jgi:ribosomal protein L16 Arg81 hydroxylase
MRYADHEEIVEAGDAFYFPPGHAPEAEAGTELVQFSPSDQLAAVVAEMKRSMKASTHS